MNVNDIKHAGLKKWILDFAALTTPEEIVIADGSSAQYDELVAGQLAGGYCVELNPEKRPGSIAYNSDPSDVARVENRTYIAARSKEAAGPTNNWTDNPSIPLANNSPYTLQKWSQGRR